MKRILTLVFILNSIFSYAQAQATIFVNPTIPKVLSANVVSNSSTRTDVATWVTGITAGKTYKIEIIGAFQTAATTTGMSIGFYLPTGAGTIFGTSSAAINQTTSANDLATTIYAINNSGLTTGSFMTSTGVNPINASHLISTSEPHCT